MNPHVDRVVVHLVLLPAYDMRFLNGLAITILSIMQSEIENTTTVDHGHKNNRAESHATFIMKKIFTASANVLPSCSKVIRAALLLQVPNQMMLAMLWYMWCARARF